METKGITPSFAEKGAASSSAEFIQSNLLYIEEIFTACNDKLASAEISGISYSTQCGTIGKMIEDMIALQCYATSAHAQVQESLDGPLFEDFSLNATETISRIKLEDITTDNTFKMEEYTTTVDPSGALVYQTQVKPSLTMRDFLDIPEEGPVGVPMLKNVETVGEFTSLFQKDYDTMKQSEGWEVDTCIEAYMTSGEFDHKMYQPVKTLISNILDMTIVKPFIESLTGTEWITGEDLTETERDWKMAGAIVDTITLGHGFMVLKGAGYTGKEVAGALAKNAAMDLAVNTGICTVDCIGTELGIPPQIQWILSMTAGCTVSAVGSNFVLTFDDVGGKKITKELTAGEFEEFFDGEVKKVLKNNPPDLDSLDTNALKNADGLNNIDEVPVDDLEKLKKVQGEDGTGELKEDVFTRYMPDGNKVTDFSHLPGNVGIEVPGRLSVEEMTYLTQEYGVEFAQVYQRGAGIKGGGGKYFIYSGDVSSVTIPVNKDIILINHTHPRGTAYPSLADKKLLYHLNQVGAPQKTSEIIPIGNLETVRFGVNGIK